MQSEPGISSFSLQLPKARKKKQMSIVFIIGAMKLSHKTRSETKWLEANSLIDKNLKEH